MKIFYIIVIGTMFFASDREANAAWSLFGSACRSLAQEEIAERDPTLKKTEAKQQLINARRKLRPDSNGKDLRELTGPGGFFTREYTLESGERIGISALAKIEGQVLRLMHLTIFRVERKQVMFWEKDVWVGVLAGRA